MLNLTSYLVFSSLLPGAISPQDDYPARVWQPGSSAKADVVGSYVSQTPTSVTVKQASGKKVELKVNGLSTEDLRYLKTVAEVKRPFRNWSVRGQVLKGSLLYLEGFDSPLTKRRAVLAIHETGKKKGYAVLDMSPEDQAYIKEEEKKIGVKMMRIEADRYGPKWDEYSPTKSPEPFNYHETKHFIFFWGNNTKPEAKNWDNPDFRKMNFDYIEKVWSYFHSIDATTPYYKAEKKYKTNVYVSNTGLSVYPDGFAWGADRILMAPSAMLEGSMVVPHEFGHTMQLASGAFQNNDFVGWFWESHANWCAGSFIPGLGSALGVFAERCHYELDSTRMNYGSWSFLAYIEQHPRFKPSFLFDIWKEAKRNKEGNAIETPLEAIPRLAVEKGIFKGNGLSDFEDLICETAAHNVTWDYIYEDAYKADLQYLYRSGMAYRGRVLPRPVADRPDWYAPIYSHTPRQLGYNVIDLAIAPGAKEISAEVQGIVDETLKSNWRYMLVAVDAKGQARYGRLWRQGVGTMTLLPSDKSAALVVMAAPDQLVHTEFRPGYNKQKRHFPYEFRLKGCTPVVVPLGMKNHEGIAGAPHANGGGFVASTAHVDPSAYVAKDAQVLGNARVLDNAQVLGHATVMDNAVVSENARVEDYAVVRRDARVKGQARIREYAAIGDRATIQDNVRIREYMAINGNGVVGGDVLAKGFADAELGPKAPLGGGAILGQDCELHFGDCKAPLNFGLFYGFMTNEQVEKETKDNNYMAALWDMKQPRNKILVDSLTDNDGVLRGSAAFALDGSRNVLRVGKDGYAMFEGSVIDAAGITIDLQVKWKGGANNQRLLSFGSDGGTLSFTPSNGGKKAALVVTKGRFAQYLEADTALPVGKWCRVTLTYDCKVGKIYLDGKLVASKSDFGVSLDEICAKVGYLGRAYEGGMSFEGDIAYGAIYRKAFDPIP